MLSQHALQLCGELPTFAVIYKQGVFGFTRLTSSVSYLFLLIAAVSVKSIAQTLTFHHIHKFITRIYGHVFSLNKILGLSVRDVT